MPNITYIKSFFHELLSKDYKQKQQSQRDLMKAITNGHITEVERLLSSKQSCPSSPCWMSEEVILYGFAPQTVHFLSTPLGWFLNNETISKNQNYLPILKSLLNHGAIIEERELSTFFDYVKYTDRNPSSISKIKEIVSLLSNHDLDWSRCSKPHKNGKEEYLAKNIVIFLGEDVAKECGVGVNIDGIPFNNKKVASSANITVICTSTKKHFAPKSLEAVLQQTLKISQPKAQEIVNNLLEGKEFTASFSKNDEALDFSIMMEELGVFATSSLSPSVSDVSARVIMIERNEKDCEKLSTSKPREMFKS